MRGAGRRAAQDKGGEVRILLTGGAGYVGSHAARALVRAGHEVVIVDDLSEGHRQAAAGLPLIAADITDRAGLLGILSNDRFDLVMHFAARCRVGESMREPHRYYHTNVVGSLNLLDAMAAAGCRRLVFSSSAAVYGAPAKTPIAEDTTPVPVNPYGQTKLDVERALGWYARAGLVGSVSLRYFNAAGAAADGSLGEDHHPEEHLIPLAIQAVLRRREAVSIFGTDYPTPDGTCIRDYVHVEDLAAAHLAAMEAVEPALALTLNVGTGSGCSVREVIAAVGQVAGRPVPVREAPRRPGDPAVLVAHASAIRRRLRWEPRWSDLRRIIETAFAWHQAHPEGYNS